MKNRGNSVFSGPLFKENMKKLWPMSLIGFLICFISGPLPVITSYSELKANTVNNVLQFFNFGYSIVVGVLPAIAAIMVFSYLHRTASVSVVHAMPYSRKSLFVTNWLSAFAASALPFILTALILLVLRKPVTAYSGDIQYEAFALTKILGFLLNHLMIICFVLSVCVLAGMISGTTVIHFLTAGALNFLLPALYLVGQTYAQGYIYGYNYSDSIWDSLYLMNPFFFVANGPQGIFRGSSIDEWNWLLFLYFIALSFIISVIAMVLYNKRRLERAQDSYVFGFAKWIILVLIVFFSSALLGIIIEALFGFSRSLYGPKGSLIGYIIGGLIGFIAGLMIVKKSTRVFNKKALLPFAVCFACMALFIGGFSLDVLGLSKKIPAADKIDDVNIEYYAIRYNDMRVSRSESDIELARALHKSIIDNRALLEDLLENGPSGEYETVNYSSIYFGYNLKNGKTFSRYYTVPTEFMVKQPELRALYDDESMRGITDSLRRVTADQILEINYDDYLADIREKYQIIDDSTGETWFHDPETGEMIPWDAVYDYEKYGGETYINLNNASAEDKLAIIKAVADDLDALTFEMKIRSDVDDSVGNLNISLRRPITEYDENLEFWASHFSHWMNKNEFDPAGRLSADTFNDGYNIEITKDFTRTIEAVRTATEKLGGR